MSELIDGIKDGASLVKNETGTGANTALRVGGLFENIGRALEDVSGGLETHAGNGEIHKTSEQIRSEITDGDIPSSIARDQEVTDRIAGHDGSGEAHADLRNALANLENGSVVAGRSEYAEKLGTPTDSYTKAQLDTRINKHIRNVTYNAATATFVFTFEDGTTTEIDTPLESTVKDGRFDAGTSELVLVLVSGQEIRIPAAGLVKVYTGQESPTTTTQINSAGEVRVDLKQGCVDMVHLSAALQNAVNDHLTKTGDTRNNVTTFAEASARVNVVSGDTQTTMFGKIRKWFTDLRAMAFKDTVSKSDLDALLQAELDGKAGVEQIPTSLPANGGNADTVDGLHATSFVRNNDGDQFIRGALIIDTEYSIMSFKRGDTLCGFVGMGYSDKSVAMNANGAYVKLEDRGAVTLKAFKANTIELGSDGKNYSNKNEIATVNQIPTTLPANGGNSDTVDGYHAGNLMTNVFKQATAPVSGMKKGDIWVKP